MRNQRGGWLSKQWRKRPKPIWMVIVLHVLALAVALLIYVLPHHVIPREGTPVGVRSVRGNGTPAAQSEASPEPSSAPELPAEPSAEPTVEPSAEPTEPTGYFGNLLADKFTNGEVEVTENSYRSANLNITMLDGRLSDANYHVADFYIADISCLRTAFGKDQFGKGFAEHIESIAGRFGSIIALSGDYYGARDDGIVIRNGLLYRNERNINDVCILYWDGTMKCFEPHEFNAETEMANGAYQGWCFGPMLLDKQGQPMDSFNSDVVRANPRAAIGYISPGHYCFVMVDGRSNSSKGLTMTDLSQLMFDLGCTAAYNLDGGQSAEMVKGTLEVGAPYKGGRAISDVIMILDTIEQEDAA